MTSGDSPPRRRPAPDPGTPQPSLPGPSSGGLPVGGRDAAVAHWLHLTRVALPALAAAHRWPIHADHCFMRVCLDHAIGAAWHEQVRRPAIRHLDDAQLARAIAVAERVAADPASLPALNRASLAMRGKARG